MLINKIKSLIDEVVRSFGDNNYILSVSPKVFSDLTKECLIDSKFIHKFNDHRLDSFMGYPIKVTTDLDDDHVWFGKNK